MIAILLCAVALVIASAAVGNALCLLGGFAHAPAWAPVVGLCALMAIARLAIEAHGHSRTAAIACGAAAAVALCWPRVWRALGTRLLERGLLAICVLVVACLPFFVSGNPGILGVGDNNDMSAHLTTAWWLDSRGPIDPVGALSDSLVDEGYPLGPHALSAALARATGASLVHAFDAFTVAIPVLLAIAALAAMPSRAPRLARAPAAGLVALCYLAVSYMVTSAFKETTLGMLLVALGLALAALSRFEPRPPLRAGIPLGFLVAGAGYVYSYPGFIWVAGAVVIWILADSVRNRRLPFWVLPAAAGALVTFAVVVAPEIRHMRDFASSGFAAEPITGTGNLVTALPVVEALGVWFRNDYRFGTHWHGVAVALDLLALAALLAALGWYWWRRRDLAIPAAMLAAVGVAYYTHHHRSIYQAGKSLAVLAPLLTVTIAPALVACWRRGSRSVWRIAGRVTSLVLAAAMALSSFVALRDGPVGSGALPEQLQHLAAMVPDKHVLFLSIDDFAQWDLRGTRLAMPLLLYVPEPAPTRPEKPWRAGRPIDWDNFASSTLDRFDAVITPAGAYYSTAPPSFRLAARTSDFLLWRRTGPTLLRHPGEHGPTVGRILRCLRPHGAALRKRKGSAVILPKPHELNQSEWPTQPRRAGQSVTQTFHVPAGRWNVSLQYVSKTGLDLTAPGYRFTLPPNLSRFGTYWPAGTLSQPRSGPLTINILTRPGNKLARALQAPQSTIALNSPDSAPVGRLVLTRAAARPRVVPFPAACGRYLDWYHLGGRVTLHGS